MQPVIVRKRRLITYGREFIEESVRCPDKRATLPLWSCVACGHASDIGVDQHRGIDVVNCDYAPIDEASSLPEWARGAPIEAVRAVLVWQVLTSDVVCVTEETPIELVHAALEEHAIGGLPVLDESRRPIGMISPADLIRHGEVAQKAADVMTSPVLCIPDDAPIARASAMMAFEGIHHVPVVEEKGTIVGILSSLDVARFVGQLGGFLVPDIPARRRAAEER